MQTTITTIVVARKTATPYSIVQGENKKGFGMEAYLFSCLDRLVDSVLIKNNCPSTDNNKKWCNVEKRYWMRTLGENSNL